MFKIKKLILKTLTIIIILSSFLPYIDKKQVQAETPLFDDKVIDIQLEKEDQLNLYWQLKINSQQTELSENTVTLQFNHLHQLNQTALQNQLNQLNIKVEQTNDNEFLLTLPDKSKAYTIDLNSVRQADTIENANIIATLKTNSKSYQSSAVHITTEDIVGNINYINYPSHLKNTTTVHLVDNGTGQVIETQTIAGDNAYTFKDKPRFTMEGLPIQYSVLADKEINIDTTIKKYDITQKYMEQEVEGKINNHTGKSILIQLLNDKSGDVLKELEVGKDDITFKLSNIPVEDENGPIEFRFSVTGEEVTYENNVLTIGSEKVITSKKRSTDSPLTKETEEPTTESATIKSSEPQMQERMMTRSARATIANSPTIIANDYTFTKSPNFVHRQGLMVKDVIGKIDGTIDKNNSEIVWNIEFSFDGITYNPTVQLSDIKFSDNLKVIEVLQNGSVVNSWDKIDLGTISSPKTLQIRTKILNPDSPILRIDVNNISVYNQKRGSMWAQFQMITKKPQVNRVTNLHEQVEGITEPNAEVKIKNAENKLIGSATANQEGKYTVKIPKQEIGTILSLTATSPNKVESPIVKVTVEKDERTPLKDVIVEDFYDIETGVRGVSEENTFVLIKDNKGTILGSSKATNEGKFYVDLHSTFPAGTVLTAVAYDSNGKFSKETPFTVKKTENGKLPSNIYEQRIHPHPTFNGNLSIKEMAWDTRNNLRNQVPQPVEYEAGYLSKYANETKDKNEYSINLKTQGRSNVNNAPLDIILVIDNSGSMGQSRWFGKTRWRSMEEVLYPFIQNMTKNNSNVRFAVVNYATGIVSQQGFSNDYNTIKSGIPSGPQSAIWGSSGGTFTQLGLRKGSEYMNQARPEAEKAMILLTDGAPSYSYKGISATGPEDITQFSDNRLGNGTTFNLTQLSEFQYNNYEIGGIPIRNHGQATISEAKLIKKQYPNLNIFGVGLDLDLDTHYSTTAERTRVLEQVASQPKYAFNTSNILDNEIGLQRILTSITETISKSISSGIVTDPIGEMYDLDLGSDGKFNEEDYTLTASDNSLLTNVNVSYNQDTRTIKLEGLTLGNGEWVDLKYKVKLKVDSKDFQDNVWYPMNKKTELLPTKNDNRIEYPVPEAKYKKPVFSFQFSKLNENKQPLNQALFELSGENIKISAESIDGKVTFNNLKPGLYNISEVKAPPGYIKTDKIFKLEVTDTGVFKIDGNIVKDFEVINTKAPTYGSITIIKHDKDDNSVLQGAEFEIRSKKDSNLTKREITNSDGKIIFNNLPLGEYEIVEVKAPKNYQLNKQPVSVTIDETNQEKTIKISNKKVILPNTGGYGFIPYTILGILVISLSLFLRRKNITIQQ